MHAECVFSGTRQKLETQDFLGGKISVVFGGAEIDLRSAGTKREEISIKAEAVFGGIELWVPSHWQTIVRGTGVFGGFEDKTFPGGSRLMATHLVLSLPARPYSAASSLKTDASHFPEHHQIGRLPGAVDAFWRPCWQR